MRVSGRQVGFILSLLFIAGLLAALRNETPSRRDETPAPPSAPPIRLVSAPAQPGTPPPVPDVLPFRVASDGTVAPVLPPPQETGRWRNPAKPVEPTFPKRFAEPVRVRSGVADVTATPVGGNPASAPRIMEDGSLLYADAFPGCDVKYRCSALKTEEFLVVREASAPTEWSWDLGLKGLTPRYTPMDTVELLDEKGVPRLRIDAPFGTDAQGKKLRVGGGLTVKVAGTRLTLTADLKGCAFPVEIDPSWSSTGAMAQARFGHTATRLNDGRVLVVAGTIPNGVIEALLDSCEIYDPATEVWNAAANLPTALGSHTSTRVANGDVIVIGGISVPFGTPGNPLGVFPLTGSRYHPETNTWSAIADRPRGTARHTASVLQDGKILIVGGYSAALKTTGADCDVYDPDGNMWEAAGSLMVAREAHTATELADGRVLVAGGGNSSGPSGSFSSIASAEVFNPSGRTWSPTANTMNSPRCQHSAVRLNDGKIFLCNGSAYGDESASRSYEIYDPSTDQWLIGGTLPTYRSTQAATLLTGGQVFIVGGIGESGATNVCELFNPAVPTESRIAAPLFTPRFSHTLTMLADGRVLVSGGYYTPPGGAPRTVLASSEIFNPTPIASSVTLNVHKGTPIQVPFATDSIATTPALPAIVMPPANGTVTGMPPYTYTSSTTFVGTDTFSYCATDSYGTSNVATVTVTVTNAPPVAKEATVLTASPRAVAIPLGASDPDGDMLTYIVGTPAHGTLSGTAPSLTYTPDPTFVGTDSFTFKANDGVADSNTATVTINVLPSPPVIQNAPAATRNPANLAETIQFSCLATDEQAFTYAWDFGDGASGSGPNPTHAYTSFGTYSAKVTVTDAAGTATSASVAVNVQPSPPLIQSAPTGTPNPAIPGEAVQFAVAATDEQAITYAWDFGDGSAGTSAAPNHVYAAAGTYSANVTVTDAAGTASSGTVLVKVSERPSARFTTSDIVAFEGRPFGFDASFSTDPENALTAYQWSFGDGTPDGSGQLISKIYAQQGSYTVVLTVTDAAGQTDTVSRVVEVLDRSLLGLFNSDVGYAVKWDRQKPNTDTLSLTATVNVGDAEVGPGTEVGLEIAGSAFAGTLDKKLMDSRNKNALWKAKAGTKKQSPGEVQLTLKVKKANLGLSFNEAGALAGADVSEEVALPIPVRLTVAGRQFELQIDSTFNFSKGGTRASGSGEGP